jgi:hypothetical protein
MRVHPGELIGLGHGKYVRSEEVVAIEPIVEGRGPGRRTLVWVRGLPEPMVASRTEEALVKDLVAPADQMTRLHELTVALERLAAATQDVPPVLLRVLEEETGHDFGELARQAHRALG